MLPSEHGLALFTVQLRPGPVVVVPKVPAVLDMEMKRVQVHFTTVRPVPVPETDKDSFLPVGILPKSYTDEQTPVVLRCR